MKYEDVIVQIAFIGSVYADLCRMFCEGEQDSVSVQAVP